MFLYLAFCVHLSIIVYQYFLFIQSNLQTLPANEDFYPNKVHFYYSLSQSQKKKEFPDVKH